MAKYIIDVPDDRVRDYVGSTHLLMPYTMGEHKGHHDTGLNLAPYTECDREAIEDEVWGFVRIITDMSEAQRIECFGGTTCDLDDYLTYQEAKAKYKAWKKQKDELRVGDEVKENTGLWTGVVVGFDKFDDLVIMDSSGNSCCGYKTKYFRKTGRHFDEVEALLKKMRDES